MNNESISLTKKAFSNSKKEVFLKLIFSIVLRASLLIIPILLSYAIDYITVADYKTAYLMMILSIAVTLIYRVSDYYNQVAYYKLYNKLYNSYTDMAMSYTYKNSIHSLSRIKLGEFINIYNNDIDIMSTFWATSIVRVIMLIEFAFIYIYFFMVNFYIGLITIIISLVSLFILLKYGDKIELLNKNRKDTLDKKTGILQEIFLGIREIKSLNLISSVENRSKVATNNYLDANEKYTVDSYKNKTVSLFTVELFRLILFIYGIYLVSTGHMEIGIILVIYNYYTKLLENLGEIGNVNIEIRNLNTSTSRFYKIIEYSRNNDDAKRELAPDLKGKIVFDNILYGDKQNPYLRDVSFKVNPKSITVLTGKTGNDKTGIFDLLLRLNRQHMGTILIDEVDINEYSGDDYYDLVSSAREQPIFFNMSIKENMSIIEPDFAKTIDTCKTLKIHDYIMNLKDGYDTILNDNTDNINVNIKKLLSIARVFLKDSKIMLFDDVTNYFDQDTVKDILTILKQKKKEHTIIIINRDKEVLEIADKIITIEDGKVKEERNN